MIKSSAKKSQVKDKKSKARAEGLREPCAEAVAIQLEKVLASRVFRAAESQKNLLRITVEYTLNGQQMTQKVLSKAAGTGNSLNPDQAVRMTAGRIRNKLRDYYEGEGAADEVRFSMPKGGYSIIFERQRPVATLNDPLGYSSYRSYLDGRRLWAQRKPETLKSAIQQFEAAIKLKPDYVEAYAALAECYIFMAIWGFPPAEVVPHAKRNALKALEIDDRNGASHAVLATTLSIFDWNWMAADREFRTALKLGRNSVSVHCWYASHLAAVGRLKDAVSEVKAAQDLEDPPTIVLDAHAAKILYVAGEYDEALELLDAMLLENPSFYLTHWYSGLIRLETGDVAEAIPSLQRAAELSAWRNPSILSSLGYAHGLAGQPEKTEEMRLKLDVLSSFSHVPATEYAIIFSALGAMDSAFCAVERAFVEKAIFLSWLAIWPPFRNLRDDSRYSVFLHRLGFNTV